MDWRGLSGTVILAMVVLGLLGGGCSSGISPPSPLKALTGPSSEAAVARAAQNDPFPSAAESGLAALPSSGR